MLALSRVEHIWETALLMLTKRPYVFIFLAAFLTIGILETGAKRTLIFLIVGYMVAFISEFCSIRWNIPYGNYRYIYENLAGEWTPGGMPFWDSLSYVFIAYASYRMAQFIFGRHKWRSILLGTILMVLVDVIVDPLAARGNEWFLGKIFYYANPSGYFGVPITNFIGWAIVGFVMITILYVIDKKEERLPIFGLLAPLLYLGIDIFNIAVTISINATSLLIPDLIIFIPILTLFIYAIRGRKKSGIN